MKLTTFRTSEGHDHIGAALPGGAELIDFTQASDKPYFASMLALIDGGEPALGPCPRSAGATESGSRVCQGHDFWRRCPNRGRCATSCVSKKHLRQARANRGLLLPGKFETDPAKIEIPPIWFQEPIYYKCNRFAVIGTGADIEWPRYAKLLDYECEFGVFVAKRGKNIKREDARSYIFGFCIFNDVSARDQQLREMAGQLGPTKGKDFDTGNILGPWLVTADEVADPYNLTMTVRCERRGAVPRQQRRDASSVRRHHRPCVDGRNDPPRRVFRLGYRRRWMRP